MLRPARLALLVLLSRGALSLVACGPAPLASDAARSPDAAGDDAGAPDTSTSDATLGSDAALGCDQDGDGYVRDTPECVTGGAAADCDDEDARTFPGAPITCRDGHVSRCGRDRELATLADLAELGVTTHRLTFADDGGERALVVAERMALLGPGAGVVASWREDGLRLSAVSETILGGPPPPLHLPVTWHADGGTTLRAAAMSAVGRTPLVAMLDETRARVMEAGLPPVERLSRTPPHGHFLPVLALLDVGGEPSVATAIEDADGSTRLSIASASASAEVLVPSAPSTETPWLASAGPWLLWGWPGASTLTLVRTTTLEATPWPLDAPALGRGALASIDDALASEGARVVATIATTTGVASIDRACDASACTSTTGAFVLPSAPSGPTDVALSETTPWQATLLTLAVLDRSTGALRRYLVRTPSTLISDDAMADAGVRDVAMASTDRYGGRLVLIGTRYAGESDVTGILFCDIE